MDEKVVRVLRQMKEHNPFLRGMVSWVGFRQTGVRYVREAREVGATKYPLRKMIRFAWTAVTGFSYFPLQVMIYVSLILGLIAALTIPVIALLRITQGEDFFGGQATTIVLVLMMGAFQLFFLFVLGQYVARIYDEVRDRPLYVVSSLHNFDAQADVHRTAGHLAIGDAHDDLRDDAGTAHADGEASAPREAQTAHG
jgi:dolichol-phosphate mannosyltransferase